MGAKWPNWTRVMSSAIQHVNLDRKYHVPCLSDSQIFNTPTPLCLGHQHSLVISGWPGSACLLRKEGETLLEEIASDTHQDEDREEDNNNGGRDEELLPGKHSGREEEHQREADGTTEPSVGNDELVLEGQGNGPEPVNHLSQHKDAYGQREAQRKQTVWVWTGTVRDRPGDSESPCLYDCSKYAPHPASSGDSWVLGLSSFQDDVLLPIRIRDIKRDSFYLQ